LYFVGCLRDKRKLSSVFVRFSLRRFIRGTRIAHFPFRQTHAGGITAEHCMSTGTPLIAKTTPIELKLVAGYHAG
jgi:hypothetical protein